MKMETSRLRWKSKRKFSHQLCNLTTLFIAVCLLQSSFICNRFIIYNYNEFFFLIDLTMFSTCFWPSSWKTSVLQYFSCSGILPLARIYGMPLQCLHFDLIVKSRQMLSLSLSLSWNESQFNSMPSTGIYTLNCHN